MAKKPVVSQRQFKGGYAPQQPVDEWDRRAKPDPNPPSKQRMGLQLGSMQQAKPGLVGMQDYKRSKKK